MFFFSKFMNTNIPVIDGIEWRDISTTSSSTDNRLCLMNDGKVFTTLDRLMYLIATINESQLADGYRPYLVNDDGRYITIPYRDRTLSFNTTLGYINGCQLYSIGRLSSTTFSTTNTDTKFLKIYSYELDSKLVHSEIIIRNFKSTFTFELDSSSIDLSKSREFFESLKFYVALNKISFSSAFPNGDEKIINSKNINMEIKKIETDGSTPYITLEISFDNFSVDLEKYTELLNIDVFCRVTIPTGNNSFSWKFRALRKDDNGNFKYDSGYIDSREYELIFKMKTSKINFQGLSLSEFAKTFEK